MDLHGVQAPISGYMDLFRLAQWHLSSWYFWWRTLDVKWTLSLSHLRPKKGSGDAHTKLFTCSVTQLEIEMFNTTNTIDTKGCQLDSCLPRVISYSKSRCKDINRYSTNRVLGP
jgi:hypothetical protein